MHHSACLGKGVRGGRLILHLNEGQIKKQTSADQLR